MQRPSSELRVLLSPRRRDTAWHSTPQPLRPPETPTIFGPVAGVAPQPSEASTLRLCVGPRRGIPSKGAVQLHVPHRRLRLRWRNHHPVRRFVLRANVIGRRVPPCAVQPGVRIPSLSLFLLPLASRKRKFSHASAERAPVHWRQVMCFCPTLCSLSCSLQGHQSCLRRDPKTRDMRSPSGCSGS